MADADLPLMSDADLSLADRGRLPSGVYKQLQEQLVMTMAGMDDDDDDMLKRNCE